MSNKTRPIPLMPKYCLPLLFLLLLACSPAQASGVPAPAVAAKSWLLADYHSGKVLAEHRADERRDPASLTKLMTAYLLFADIKAGKLDPDRKISVSETARARPGARMYLVAGEKVRVDDLLRGMLVQSANDATAALVEHVAGNEADFVTRMNAAAASLGMDSTRFANSTGQSTDGQQTSARDLNRLAVALIREFPDFYQRWHGLKEFSHNGLTQYNRNTLLWSLGGADGMKTGHTRAAGYCLVASAMRNRMRLVATVLGAKDDKSRAQGAGDLLEHGFRHYETRLLYQEQVPAINMRVWLGDTDMLPAGLDQDVYLTLARGQFVDLKAKIQVMDAPRAPISKGDAVGSLSLLLGQEQIAEYPLRALRDVRAGNTAQRLLDNLRMRLQ